MSAPTDITCVIVSALADHATELARGEADPVLGPPSLSVGRIEGGISVNVVPDRAEVEIDRRLVPGETPEGARDRVRRAVERTLGGLDRVEFLPPWVVMPSLAPRPDADERWVLGLAAAIERVGRRQPGIRGVPFGTDGGPLGEAGLPCFVFGPGDIAQAHTVDEWVELDQVRQAAEMYFEIARELGRC